MSLKLSFKVTNRPLSEISRCDVPVAEVTSLKHPLSGQVTLANNMRGRESS